MEFSPNLGKNKCFRYFLGLEFCFKLESGVKIEPGPIKSVENVDFRVKMTPGITNLKKSQERRTGKKNLIIDS